MKNIKRILNKIPGWFYILIFFGFLYLTGMQAQVMGQVQRLVLTTGLLKPKIPKDIKAGLDLKTDDSGNKISNLLAYPVADYNFQLLTLAGETVPFATLKGKVIFMNMWATWCPPCIAEMPNIQNLYQKVKSENIAFVMISFDKDPAKAQQFIQRRGFTFPVYFLNGNLPPPLGTGHVIPATYVISPTGHVVVQKEGMAQYDNQEFRDFLLRMAKTGNYL